MLQFKRSKEEIMQGEFFDPEGFVSPGRKRRKRIGFGWYGGKYNHLEWLLPLLAKTREYCEPFGGSAAVLLNRQPAQVETYNDLDGELVNFFRVLRDQKDKLIEALALTPFSREEFYLIQRGQSSS